jgi:hypothetical protein
VAGVTPAWADPGTLYVDGATGSDDSDCSDPTDPCATIGYALSQALNGDDIRVAEGTYTETVDIGITVTLKGGYTMSGTLWLPSTGETIVDADGADASVFTIGPGNQVMLEGLTVQGANHVNGEGGGFYINGATVVISDTVIRDNATDQTGGGVWIENTAGTQNAHVSLINSTASGDSAANGSGGLMVGDHGPIPVTLENTVFTGNAGDNTLGLDRHFEIVGGQVVSNVVSGFTAISIGGSGSGTISGTLNLDDEPRYVDAISGDYRLGIGSPCTDAARRLARQRTTSKAHPVMPRRIWGPTSGRDIAPSCH